MQQPFSSATPSPGLEANLRRLNPWWRGAPMAPDDPRVVSLPLSTLLLLR